MTKNGIVMAVAGVAVLAAGGFGVYRFMAGDNTTNGEAAAVALANGSHRITLKTNYGEIQFQTYDSDAPKTAENFVKLAGQGFYNNLTFHRVVKGFVIHGGRIAGPGGGGNRSVCV